MVDGRVKISNGNEFNPREWLRKEVLWASLMSPYSTQVQGWQQRLQRSQHQGNVNRQSIYSDSIDPEVAALGFFNQGKNIAGMISSAVLFDVMSVEPREGAYVDILESQTTNIDKVLAKSTTEIPTQVEEDNAFDECEKLVQIALKGQLGKRQRLQKAKRIMIGLASAETASWLRASRQSPDSILPLLEIPDGGTPRSDGERVQKLQPIFHKIVDSARYQSL